MTAEDMQERMSYMDMERIPRAELRDAVRIQDPLQVSHRETRTTDVDAWLRNLKLDVDAGAVIDPVVYLSVISHLACINDVLGKRVIGGDREAGQYRRRSVEASYVRFDTIQKLSVYCGIVFDGGEATGNSLAASKATGERITGVLRQLQVGLSRYKQLQVRSGLALHLHSISETWSAGPEDAIEVPAEEHCYKCGAVIHFANGHWRDESGKYDVYSGTNVLGRGRSTFDHSHNIEAPE